MLKSMMINALEQCSQRLIERSNELYKKRKSARQNTELTEEMGVRRMEIYHAAAEYCEMLLDREPGIPTKQPLSLEILGPFIYESAKFFRKHGFEVCVPRVIQKKYTRKCCTLKSCKCRECKYSGKK